MPYLVMYLDNNRIDEVFISEVLLQSVLSHHTILEEKRQMLERNAETIRNSEHQPVFVLDTIPSSINGFSSLSNAEDQKEING